MYEKDQYKAIAVALLLVLIITVLISPPGILLQRGVIVDRTSAFQDSKICYNCAGWSAVNETQVEVTLNASIWAASGSYAGENDATILINELPFENEGRYKLIKYFYIKELIFVSSPDDITIVRAKTVVDDPDDANHKIDEFYSEILPYLFVSISGGGIR